MFSMILIIMISTWFQSKQGATSRSILEEGLVKLSRWRAKKSGPKFKMKIVFCISTNIQHDMHCFCFPELNVEPGIQLKSDQTERLLNKPYVNGVNLREQNLSLKCC